MTVFFFLSIAKVNTQNSKEPPQKKEQGKIAFAKDNNIYLMDADGKNQIKLTATNEDRYPAWSPDGKKIAFMSNRDGNYEIYILNIESVIKDIDDKEQKNLTNKEGAWDGDPAWSPDGKKIAFASTRDGNYEIYLIDVDGKNVKRLTESKGDDRFPNWSQDGKKIVFMSESKKSGSPEIYIMDADGKNPKQLTNNTHNEWSPVYSPDGKKIVFGSDREKNKPAIYIMDIDGKNQEKIADSIAHHKAASWSSDGKKIVFEVEKEGKHEIYVMDVDGKNLTKIADGEQPAWQPVEKQKEKK